MTATAPDSSQPPDPADLAADNPNAAMARLMKYVVGVAGLFLLTLTAYVPALRAGFIWDDNYYVTENQALKTFDGLQRIWVGILPDARQYPMPQYYPMTATSFWLEHHLWGNTPLGYHLINVLLHATAAWVLWVILRKLRVPGAWVIAAVFAVHPLQVESVAWITERKNILSALFAFLSLLIYLRFAGIDPAPALRAGEEEPTFGLPAERWKVYLLALVLFVFALLSKSVVSVLPGAILLILWWRRGRLSLIDDVLPVLPFFALAIAMGFVTRWMEQHVVGARGPEWEFTVPQRILIAGHAVWFYVAKILLPWRQSFFYPKWDVADAPAWWWAYPAAVVGVIVVLWALRKRIGRGPLVGWLLFLGLLFPALGFISFFPMRYSFVADHFQYLAQIGLVAVIVAAVAKYIQPREAGATVAAIFLAAYVVLSAVRARVFENQITLWTDTIEKNPSAWAAYTNLGAEYLRLAARTDDPQYLKLAEENLHAGRRISAEERQIPWKVRPTTEASSQPTTNATTQPASQPTPKFVPDPVATLNLGLLDERNRNFPRAIRYYQQAIEEWDQLYPDPTFMPPPAALPHYNLAVLLTYAGKLDDAIHEYQTAVQLAPRFVAALENLAEVYRQKKQYDDAITTANAVLDIDPESLNAHNTLASSLAEQGRLQEAIQQWQIVLRQDPDNYVAMNNIGRVFAVNMGRLAEAEVMFKRALEKKPDFAPAQQNLAALERLRQRAATQASTRPTTAAATTGQMTTTTPAR